MVVERKVIEDFIRRAYDTACGHGFHDVELSDQHMLMLVIGEIGEMVEADRKSRRADVASFKALEEIRIGSDAEYAEYVNKCFVEHIKDTLEDELADVCIRIFDFCGLRKITPAMSSKGVFGMQDEFKRIFGGMTICKQCFSLSCLVCDVGRYGEKWGKDRMEREIGAILSFCFEFARFHGIDLEWHIEQKMRYNESRPPKHGKKY